MVCVCLRLIGSLIDWRARYLSYSKYRLGLPETGMVLLVVSFTSGASKRGGFHVGVNVGVNVGYLGTRQKDIWRKKTKLGLKSCEKPRDKVRDVGPEVSRLDGYRACPTQVCSWLVWWFESKATD